MHSAPAVSYPVGRSSWALAFTALLLLLNLSVLLFWWFKTAAWIFPVGLGVAWTLTLGVLALHAGWHQPVWQLQWDGQTWHLDTLNARLHPVVEGRLATPIGSGQVTVRLDGQRFLLAEFRSDTGPQRWLILSRAHDPARWGLLRCALVASANGAAQRPVRSAAGAEPVS